MFLSFEIKLSDGINGFSDPFYSDYLESVRALRADLIAAFELLNIESKKPRETARQLGLDKSLAWKITRIIHEEDASKVAGAIPGTSGMRQVTHSLMERELPKRMADSITQAYEGYLEMTRVHSSNKNSYELMLDGMKVHDEDVRRKSRQYAFRGNCGIWGIQSDVRVSAHVLTINRDDPSLLNYAGFGGLTGFQRLRPGQPWPIFQFLGYEDSGEPLRSDMVPIGDDPSPDFPLIINEFCKGSLPELQLWSNGSTVNYEFGDGLIGKTGKCDVFLGYIDMQPKPRYKDRKNQYGELMCLIDTPIETLMFDLIVERELAERIHPESLIYGRANGPNQRNDVRSLKKLVPFKESLKLLEPGANMLMTPLIPSYNKLGERVIGKLGRDMSEFVCWRLMLDYPIMPSTVSIRFELEDADNSGQK